MGDRLCCSEVFTNCAEVQLVGEGESSPSPSPTTSAPATDASTTIAPSTPATTSTTTTAAPGSGEGACVRNTDCAANPWCAAQTNCPSPQCTRGTGGSDSPASPVPEPEPEPEPVESDSSAMTCTATPGLNAGVTDTDCAKCADGYKWWPCNTDGLCQCSGSALFQVDPKVVPTRRATRSKRGGAFLAPDHPAQ